MKVDFHGSYPFLPKGEFLRGRYLQQGNSKNNICQGINIAVQHYYLGRDLHRPEKAALVGPLIDDLVYKVDNKSDADEKSGMTQQITIVMRDHEIDLIHTKKNDEKGIKKTEVGGEFANMMRGQVFREPDRTGDRHQDVEEIFPEPGSAPNLKLPDNQDPFSQNIDIADYGIAGMFNMSEVAINQFRDDAGHDKDNKGLIAFADPAKTYQPGNKGKQDRERN